MAPLQATQGSALHRRRPLGNGAGGHLGSPGWHPLRHGDPDRHAPRRPAPLPADAIFQAVLIDAAIADAPALELGRFRLRPAGPVPFRFRIAYPDSAITPVGRYKVRATVRYGEQLLYTTNTSHPVLTGGASPPLVLRLVPVRVSRPGPLGHLPASWRGEHHPLAERPGPRWHLPTAQNLSPDQQQSSALQQVFRVPCWSGFVAPCPWQRLGSRSAR